MDDDGADLGLHAVEDAPAPDAPHADDTPFIEPDHTASKDPGVIERVRLMAQGGKGSHKDAPKDAPKSRPQPRPASGRSSVTDVALRKGLVELYTSLGIMLLPMDAVCGEALVNAAPRCADSLVLLAKQNAAVRRALLALTQTSAWGGVVLAHAPLVLAVLAHHGPEDMRQRLIPLAILLNGQPVQPEPESEAS